MCPSSLGPSAATPPSARPWLSFRGILEPASSAPDALTSGMCPQDEGFGRLSPISLWTDCWHGNKDWRRMGRLTLVCVSRVPHLLSGCHCSEARPWEGPREAPQSQTHLLEGSGRPRWCLSCVHGPFILRDRTPLEIRVAMCPAMELHFPEPPGHMLVM